MEDSEVETDGEAPTSMDGETLTRVDNDGLMLLGGGDTMGKSTCVTFAAYQSARWKCHRYEVDGSHSYGHYFYTNEIAYHCFRSARVISRGMCDWKSNLILHPLHSGSGKADIFTDQPCIGLPMGMFHHELKCIFLRQGVVFRFLNTAFHPKEAASSISGASNLITAFVDSHRTAGLCCFNCGRQAGPPPIIAISK